MSINATNSSQKLFKIDQAPCEATNGKLVNTVKSKRRTIPLSSSASVSKQVKGDKQMPLLS